MTIQILDNEAVVLKKIRAMAGCKRADVTVVRHYVFTAYLVAYAGYEFDLVTNTHNTIPLALRVTSTVASTLVHLINTTVGRLTRY